jgi:hypothetical protein
VQHATRPNRAPLRFPSVFFADNEGMASQAVSVAPFPCFPREPSCVGSASPHPKPPCTADVACQCP